MIVEHIDQRDVQKKGGLYAKFPSSYIICSMLERYNCKSVLDITYGEGRFYKTCRDNILFLIGSDPKKWDWIVKPDLFYQFNVFYLYMLLSKKNFVLPLRELDVVVVDPPRWKRSNYNRRKMYNYIIGTPEKIIEYAGKIAKLLSSHYLVVHYDKIIDVEYYTPERIIVFEWFARYLNINNNNKSFYILYHSL